MKNLTDELEDLRRKHQIRSIPDIISKSDGTIVVSGKEYINYASNDYLGISTNIYLRDEFLAGNKSLLSSASARLLTGSSTEFTDLETVISKIFNKESALIFNTGYQANIGVISALAGKGDVVFSDKLNHASIIDGMRLSRGDFYRYKHLDYENLEKLLIEKRGQYKRAVIVSESVFSMDGDVSDTKKLAELKRKYDCVLMIDEAHAFYASGDTPYGISYGNDVDIITATFGKAVGSFGAFCVSNSQIKEYLINKSRSFIFSTALPPLNVAWSYWLLTEKSDFMKNQWEKLQKLVHSAHKYLEERNILTPSSSQIIPVILGGNDKAVRISEFLRSKGYYVPAIRPPTVPEGSARLRVSLTADCNISDFTTFTDMVDSISQSVQ